MPKKPASLDQFKVSKPGAPPSAPKRTRKSKPAKTSAPPSTQYIKKGLYVTEAASQAFNILCAEQGPRSGPRLAAEAFNLLFKKYGKEPVA